MNLKLSISLFTATIIFSATVFAQHDKNKIIKEKIVSVQETKITTDTLRPASFATGTPVLYSFIEGGYSFGVNALNDHAFAQKYKVPQSYLINGVAFWVGAKKIIGDADTLSVNFYTLDGPGTDTSGAVNNAPDSIFISKTITTSQINSSGLTIIPFTDDTFIVFVDYAVGVDISTMDDDTIGIFSTTDGDALQSQLSWVKWADDTWHTVLESFNWGMDLDFGIFIIADMSAANINDNYFIDGLKLSQNQPNPASEYTLVQYELNDNSNDVSLEIYDMNGKLINKFSEGKQLKGLHEIKINSGDLKSGSYYYSLKAGNHRLTKKMIVAK
ncbi:MAG TPA: T9SS type A sorting domain-containing protein [Bacteroidales bacterium]|nr:T9SS type A sorting domain-containing protein [Bacteroidales bacterium]HPS17119.1 T9SS type A sorting domain-containing protein [Bacteroidales bacterium]